jgi:hypothetical protein
VTQRLGEILVSEGACPASAIAEALQSQAIFGARLGTNLLELGRVTEEALAFALGKQSGAPALFGELPPDPVALRLVDRKVADRWNVVPFLVAERRLALLARDPGDFRMLDELAFATGRRVQAFVVPEARIWRMLRKSYGLDRERRGIDVGPDRRAWTPPPAPVAAPILPADDLMEEAEFEGLYGQLSGHPTPAPGTLQAVIPPQEAGTAAQPEALDAADLLELLEASSIPAAVPTSTATSTPTPTATSTSTPTPTPTPTDHDSPLVAEPSPLSFADALRFLEGVEERGAIARTVLRHARSRFRRALLLTIRHGEAHGWAGLGGGLTPAMVHAIRLPLATPGAVATVVSTRAPFVGPLPKTWSNIRLLKGLGGGVPSSALLVPVVALGRVVNVLYADNGRGQQVEAGDVGDLLILATRIAQSYDALARRAV